MLRKLSTSAFVVSLILTWLLRSNAPQIEHALALIDISAIPIPKFGPIDAPLGTLIPAIIIAILSEAIKLHDKISDILGIREKFDVAWILEPMAKKTGVNVTPDLRQKLIEQRKELMGNVFYQYVSSTPGRAIIDPHTITQALTSWSWYWLAVEAIFLSLITMFALLFIEQYESAGHLLFAILALSFFMWMFSKDCRRYAISQVGQILADQNRANAVEQAMNALQD